MCSSFGAAQWTPWSLSLFSGKFHLYPFSSPPSISVWSEWTWWEASLLQGLWKSCSDLETEQEEHEKTRNLYLQLSSNTLFWRRKNSLFLHVQIPSSFTIICFLALWEVFSTAQWIKWSHFQKTQLNKNRQQNHFETIWAHGSLFAIWAFFHIMPEILSSLGLPQSFPLSAAIK